MKSTTATVNVKNWTAFELLILAPFGLLLWYVGTQPLVLPAAPSVNVIVPVATTAVPAEQVFVAPAGYPDSPVFITAGSTVLQRIAPVARLVLEVQEVVAATQNAITVLDADAPTTSALATGAVEQGGVESVVATPMRMEISDGTGIDGFANEIILQLEKSGVTVSKTANMVVGTQRRTVILYRDGFEEEAQRLSKLFARPPAMVNNTRSRSASDASDVRLILGSAAVREKGLQALRATASGM